MKSISNARWLTWEHSGTSRQYSIGVKIFPDIYITFHDTVISGLVDTSSFHTYKQNDKSLAKRLKN